MATADIEARMLDDTLAWAHDGLRLTYDEIGGILDVSDRTLRRWREHRHLPRARQRERIEDMRELRHLLQQAFPRPEHRDEWLHSPSAVLRGRTPISLLRSGKIARVVDALATLESGAFT